MTKGAALRTTLAIATLLAAGSAAAHPGHLAEGWGAGFAHPLSGADHALAAIAVGLWAAQLGRRAMLAVPAAFVGAMALGAVAAFAAIELPFVEAGIAVSMLVVGLLVALAVRLPLAAGAALAASFAVLHGYAHGGELPVLASQARYVAGFAGSTLILLAAGVAAGRLMLASDVRLAGACVAVTGLALVAAV